MTLHNSKWIGALDWRTWRHPSRTEPPPSPYLIRDFSVAELPARATLLVAGLGQAAYYVNGRRLPDSIHPTPPSTYARSVFYRRYDLTPYLTVGKNRFGAVLGHVYLCDPEAMLEMCQPCLTGELLIEYPSGREERIVTDTAFLTHPSPTLFSLRRCGERYDAEKEIPAWSCPDTPTDGWTHAHLVPYPGGTLRESVCPPKRVFAEIVGREIAPGLFDFGEHLSGWVRLTLGKAPRSEVHVLYSEWLTDDGCHITQEGLMPGTHRPMLHRDVYLSRGEEGETFEPLFTYHGFRYAEVTGAGGTVTLTALKVHTDLTPLCSFTSDNRFLNGIRLACENSILACAHHAMLDCPQREQNEWTGDGMLSAEVIAMEYDAYDFYCEWIRKFLDDQSPSGRLPAIVPCRSNWPFNFANGLDWSSAMLHIPYYAYKYTGDPAIVHLALDGMERAMEYFATRSDSCLMDFGVGDWCSQGPPCPIEITDTLYYRIDALMLAKMCEAIGRPSERWRTLAEEIRRDFRKKYVRDGVLTVPTLTPLVGAVYAGMLEGEEIATAVRMAAEIVERDGYALRCGVHGLRMLFDVFGEHGYNELVLRVLTNPAVPGYAKAVADGLRTLPESFLYRTRENDTGKYPSLNHQFTAAVDGWLFRYVAGIRYEGFGQSTLTVAPCLLDGLREFSATVRGVTVSRSGDRLTVTSPVPFTLRLGTHSTPYPAGRHELSV